MFRKSRYGKICIRQWLPFLHDPCHETEQPVDQPRARVLVRLGSGGGDPGKKGAEKVHRDDGSDPWQSRSIDSA